MIPSIVLSWPPVIEFGAGKLETLPAHLEGARKVFFLCDCAVKGLVEGLIERLGRQGIETRTSTSVVPEPPIATLNELVGPAREFSPDAVVGVGGGSAMDLAKLVAALLRGDQKFEEIVGTDKIKGRTTRLIAVPTTSGTGSEVTPIAVLTDTEEKLKKGVVSRYLIPDVAIVDPELTVGLPPALTASTGMDALTHCIEAYTNRHSHPLIDSIALEGIRQISSNIERAVASGEDLEARMAMSFGSLCGGLCLGPVNTAAVHAMAYPLGGEFKVSHGVSNSVLLPFVMQFNLPAVEERYAKIALAMGLRGAGSSESLARKAIERIHQISCSCGIPSSLAELGIPRSAIPAMAKAAVAVKRLMNNNPREVSIEDAEQIYCNAHDGLSG